MTAAFWFSILFYVSFVIYSMFGSYILFLNAENALNRLFFSVCLSLSVWCFAFSIANSAPNYEMVLFWRRISVIGWGVVYSILVHYALILTRPKGYRIPKILYLMIYIPSFFSIIIFGASSYSVTTYHLVETGVGWVNISQGGIWDVLFTGYCLGYGLWVLVLIGRWGYRSKDSKIRWQSFLIVTSFALNLLLGAFSDIILNAYTRIRTPQLAPVFSLISITAIFYVIRKYGLMNQDQNAMAEPGRILSEVNLAKIFNISTMICIIAGMVDFAAQFFFNMDKPDFSGVFVISVIFIGTGLCLQIIKFIKIKDGAKESLFGVLMTVAFLVFTLYFSDTGSITIWAAPFIMIVVSVLFNKKRILVMLGGSVILTEIYIWWKVPYVASYVDGSDYLSRISILGIGVTMAYFVNRIYVKRLQENETQFQHQKMISQVSSEFVNANEGNLKEKIEQLLSMLGEFFKVDNVFFYHIVSPAGGERKNSSGMDCYSAMYTWCKPESDIQEDQLRAYFPEKCIACYGEFKDGMDLQEQIENQVMSELKLSTVLHLPVLKNGSIIGTLCFIAKDQKIVWTREERELLSILDNILSDALIKIEAEREILHMAYYDGLTGLPNRKLFRHRLEEDIALAEKFHQNAGVMFIDLDAFKDVNDTMGHVAGDELLYQVARRLEAVVGTGGTVGRFGGDEFLVSTGISTTVGAFEDFAKSILRTFEEPVFVQEQEFFVKASIGISVYPVDGTSEDQLIQNADLAMYTSKEKGKNQYTLCSMEMKDAVVKKAILTNRLFRAMEKQELKVLYQPQVDAQTGKIVGAEALLRWNQEEYGMVSPSVFIPLAEKTGLINPIGEWVLEQACQQWAHWRDMGIKPIRMAANLSIEQFHNPGLVHSIDRIMKNTGIDPSYLELEITESVAVKESWEVEKVLSQLKEFGVQIAIDDFGAEYSSLGRIKNLPVDRLKIDMQFAKGIEPGNKDEVIAMVILQLAQKLNLQVIAEGVETENQFAFFKNQGCHEIQGFYFYRPMPPEELEMLLIEQKH